MNSKKIRLGIPKGRMQKNVLQLLSDAGIKVEVNERNYRPKISLENIEIKLLKPQNIAEMLSTGSMDIGFTGKDWVTELGLDLVDLMDTEFDPVTMVAACPTELLANGKLPNKKLIVASEYEVLTKAWIKKKGLGAIFIKSYGATEVFPPEDADVIVDITSTGSTLKANNLEIIDELMPSSTRLFASQNAANNPEKRKKIDELILIFRSVFEAERRVMLEINVDEKDLESIIKIIPCMKEPTLSKLSGGAGYAVKAAVPREKLPTLIPEIKRRGGSDIVVTQISQIIP